MITPNWSKGLCGASLVRGVFALALGLSAAVEAQTQEAPNWNLTAPSTTTQAQPMQRRQPPRMQQPMTTNAGPGPGAAAAVTEGPASQVPDGYQALRLRPPPTAAPPDDLQRSQSHLPETSLPEERQIAILRKRIAELVRQMDDLQVRMANSEQALATHRHGYATPNLGFISGQSYANWLKRAEENNSLVPFISGTQAVRGTTTPPVLPQ